MAPNVPEKFRAARFMENGGPLVLQEMDTKLPEQGEILVKVRACGVCGVDDVVQHEHMGVKLFVFCTSQRVCRLYSDNDRPLTPGHEVIGDVAAVGPGEKHWKVGDRVGGGWHGGHDGEKMVYLASEIQID